VSDMKQNSQILNGALVLILLLLLGWGGYSWLQPKFPATVKGDDIVPPPRELKTPALSRLVYSSAVVNDVARLNLFRKQRKKYYRPKPKPRPIVKARPTGPKVAVAPPPPPKPTAPPPQLVLTGVLLLANQKVAIFEGTYSEIRAGQLVKDLKPRRRGYKIGETIGGYKIKAIDKSRATLAADSGSHLTLTISKTPPTQKIQKSGNRLIQKNKSVASNIPGRPPVRQTRRSQRIPIPKRPMNRTASPVVTPPAVATPGAAAPAPKPSNRIPRSKQRSMGF
jgi:hypothetical protein